MVLSILVNAGYRPSLVRACSRSLGCIKGWTVYVVRRNGVVDFSYDVLHSSSIWAYIRDPRYVRDRGIVHFSQSTYMHLPKLHVLACIGSDTSSNFPILPPII